MNSFLKWLIRICAGVAGLALLVILVLWLIFYSWRRESIDALPGNSRIVEISDGPVEYRIQGDSDRHILLVHGTPGSYRTFGIDPLLENGYSVISPSRPGYFRTPLSVGASPSEQADAFAALLNTLQVDSVTVISISGGGPSAVQFAIRYPEKCSLLILMASPVKRIPDRPPTFLQRILSTEFGRWINLKMMLSKIEDPVLAQRAETYVQTSVFPFSETREGSRNDFYQMTHLSEFPLDQIDTPTLVIHGTADTRLASHARYAAKRIPDAELLTLEGKGHFDVVFFDVETSYEKAIEFISKN